MQEVKKWKVCFLLVVYLYNRFYNVVFFFLSLRELVYYRVGSSTWGGGIVAAYPETRGEPMREVYIQKCVVKRLEMCELWHGYIASVYVFEGGFRYQLIVICRPSFSMEFVGFLLPYFSL